MTNKKHSLSEQTFDYFDKHKYQARKAISYLGFGYIIVAVGVAVALCLFAVYGAHEFFKCY